MIINNGKIVKGVASLFVVIFTTLLLSVITLGFVHIILSESTQTTNTNLSQSAYDSALAGIEDAKITIMKYHECISMGDTSELCTRVKNVMNENKGTAPEYCNVIRQAMEGRPAGEEGETIIQSEDVSNLGEASELGKSVNQAYTCVLINEENPDFIAELRNDYRTKLVPIRAGTQAQLNRIKYVKFQWFSNADLTPPIDRQNYINSVPNNISRYSMNPSVNKSPLSREDSGLFQKQGSQNSSVPAPPAVSIQLIQSAPGFELDDFNINRNSSSTNTGTLVLVPVPDTPSFQNAMPNNGTIDSSAFVNSADKASNSPIPIRCANGNPSASDYLCTAIIGIPTPNDSTSRNISSMFLRVAVPYGVPNTTFSITLCGENDDRSANCDDFIPFVGVQAKVDSTGRANDLFRRVEARIELTDTHFPIPDFALQLSGDGDNSLNKNFWATINNWEGRKDTGYVSN